MTTNREPRSRVIADADLIEGFTKLGAADLAMLRKCDTCKMNGESGITFTKSVTSRGSNPFAATSVERVSTSIPVPFALALDSGTHPLFRAFQRSIHADDAVQFSKDDDVLYALIQRANLKHPLAFVLSLKG